MAKKKKSKFKKILKKAAKAALIGGALYGGSKLLKSRGLKGNAKKLTEGDIGIGLRPPRVDDYNYTPKKRLTPSPIDPTNMWDNPWGAKGGGIAKRGTGAAYKKGGRVKSMGIAKRGGGAAKR